MLRCHCPSAVPGDSCPSLEVQTASWPAARAECNMGFMKCPVHCCSLGCRQPCQCSLWPPDGVCKAHAQLRQLGGHKLALHCQRHCLPVALQVAARSLARPLARNPTLVALTMLLPTTLQATAWSL